MIGATLISAAVFRGVSWTAGRFPRAIGNLVIVAGMGAVGYFVILLFSDVARLAGARDISLLSLVYGLGMVIVCDRSYDQMVQNGPKKRLI